MGSDWAQPGSTTWDRPSVGPPLVGEAVGVWHSVDWVTVKAKVLAGVGLDSAPL